MALQLAVQQHHRLSCITLFDLGSTNHSFPVSHRVKALVYPTYMCSDICSNILM